MQAEGGRQASPARSFPPPGGSSTPGPVPMPSASLCGLGAFDVLHDQSALWKRPSARASGRQARPVRACAGQGRTTTSEGRQGATEGREEARAAGIPAQLRTEQPRGDTGADKKPSGGRPTGGQSPNRRAPPEPRPRPPGRTTRPGPDVSTIEQRAAEGGGPKGQGPRGPQWGQNTPRQPPAKARTTRDRAGGGAGPRGPKGAPQWPNKRRYRGGEEADPRQRNHAPRADPRALRGNYGAKGGAPRTGPLRATSPGPERRPHSAGPSPATAEAAAGAVRSSAPTEPQSPRPRIMCGRGRQERFVEVRGAGPPYLIRGHYYFT